MHVFIFRRDLRLEDNCGLAHMYNMMKPEDTWVPMFIFNKSQIDPRLNTYFSNNSVQFMIESIISLDQSLDGKLNTFEGRSDTCVLQSIHKKTRITNVHYNVDFTPFARKRDEDITRWCERNGIVCHAYEDEYSLVHVQSMPKPYQVFTPFYKKQLRDSKVEIPRYDYVDAIRFRARLLKEAKVQMNKYYKPNKDIAFHGGRNLALEQLKRIRGFADYDKTRDMPANTQGTTRLSAALKYGNVSVREVYHTVLKAFGKSHGIIRELYWRAFYEQLTWWFPKVLSGMTMRKDNVSLRENYDKIKWTASSNHFEAWKHGETGFPIVDAAMREMNKTGWMHNRCRMIVASFLVKDLHIDWRKGEHYFSQVLIDIYHPSNNGGWQWSSGGGADAQQYNRIFNPWLQAQRFDPECIYIKRWIPELKDVPCKAIHSWKEVKVRNTWQSTCKYPSPIVDHSEAAKSTLSLYKSALKQHG